MKQIKVYITAKREHADKLKNLRVDGIHINARWLHMIERGEQPVTHWLQENFDDAVMSHFVIFYVEAGDKLKTSLIEIGNALAYGKQIFIASDRKLADDPEQQTLPHKDLAPWVAFAGIKFTGTLEDTFAYIKQQVSGHEKITKAGNVGLST